MELVLAIAEPADAARIAEIHMAAFGTNAMLLAQFPTPTVRESLQNTIEKKALADITDPNITVLVVRASRKDGAVVGSHASPENGQTGLVKHKDEIVTISFAKWSHPTVDRREQLEPVWNYPEGTNLDVLGKWHSKVDEVQERNIGSTPCYRRFPYLY